MGFKEMIKNEYKFNLENFLCWFDEGNSNPFAVKHTLCLDKPNISMQIRTGESMAHQNYGIIIKTEPTSDPNVCNCNVILRIGEYENPIYKDEFNFKSNEPIDVESFAFNFFGLVYHALAKSTPLSKSKKEIYFQTGDALLNNLEKIKQHQVPDDLKSLLGDKDYDKFIKRLSYGYGALVYYNQTRVRDRMMGDED